jgi:TolB-like protein/DNA-binding winged helix-turn-helix (wHTH) protein
LRYLFEDYTFDTERRELHRGADAVSITPQVFDLLDYLIRNRERVVSKDDLISAVWNGRIVSDAALTTRLNAARNAIGDSGEEQRLLKTLPRKGFRFVGTVQETKGPAIALTTPDRVVQHPKNVARPERSDVAAQHGLVSGTHDGGTIPLFAPRLSVVVLPFANVSGDPAQDYFADGVTETLTTDLSRLGNSFVISRNSAFSYKGKSIDARQIGRELNVRHVLEGSVQRGRERLRVNVQLIDAESGRQLWAERFDPPIADLLDMQDEIVSRLANALNTELIEAEARRAEHSLHPDALDLYFQGKACMNRAVTPASLAQARDFFTRALTLDPEDVEAAIGTAEVDVSMGAAFMTDDKAPHLEAAETTLIKVLSRAPNHAKAHMLFGATQMFSHRTARGIAECERALTLDRNLADAYGYIGFGKYLSGCGAETEALIHEAFRLSPRDTRAHLWIMFVGLGKLAFNADVEALAWFQRSLEANRNHPLAHFHFAAALGLVGDIKEARSAAQAGLALDLGFTIRRYRINAKSDHPKYLATRERIHEGMRMAGVPEG